MSVFQKLHLRSFKFLENPNVSDENVLRYL